MGPKANSDQVNSATLIMNNCTKIMNRIEEENHSKFTQLGNINQLSYETTTI